MLEFILINRYTISCRYDTKKYAGMAQLAEQLTCNQQVVGSSPIASSICGGVPEWPKGADCKSVAIRFDGSNPSSSTKYPYL